MQHARTHTQMDLCSEEAIARAEANIRAINSSVHIVRTAHSAVDWNVLLHRKGCVCPRCRGFLPCGAWCHAQRVSHG